MLSRRRRVHRAELAAVLCGCLMLAGCDAAPQPPAFPSSTDTPTIAEKLERQWRHFEHATAALAEHVGRRGRSLSRQQWERLIEPEQAYRLRDEEFASLRQDQAQRIAAARAAAVQRSVLDLHKLRASGQVEAFARALPKGGMLHVHPIGTIDRVTSRRLLDAADPRIDPRAWRAALSKAGQSFHPDELTFLETYRSPLRFSALREADRQHLVDLFHLPPGSHDFDRFAAVFELVSLVRANSDAFPDEMVYEAFFSRAREHNVMYVELTQRFDTSPQGIAQLQRMAKLADASGVVVRVNFAFPRTRSAQQNQRQLQNLLDLPPPRDLVVGVDLVGPEQGHPAFEAAHAVYARLLALESADQRSLRRTIHVGGLGDVRNGRDALLLGADRVGHGVGLMRDPIALEYAAMKQLPVEVNLTSNVRLRYVESYENHPFLDLLRLGCRVSLSTDDEGMLGTDISREFALAILHSDISWDEVKRLCLNAIETGFAEAEVKSRLLSQLSAELEAFEARWLPRIGTAFIP